MRYRFKSATFFYGAAPHDLGDITEFEPEMALVTVESLDIDKLNAHLAWRSGDTLTAGDIDCRGVLKATDPLIDFFQAKMYVPPMLVYHGSGFSVAWLAEPEPLQAAA